jgi:hypothetical protein
VTMPTATIEPSPKRYAVSDRHGRRIGTGELRFVPVGVIKIDPRYQRDRKSAWLSDHLPFDPNKAIALLLSDRAGGPYCIDGQQRLALAEMSGVKEVRAMVITGMSQKDEANLFFEQDERTRLTTWAKWRAALVGERPEEIDITRIVTSSGFRLDNKSANDRTITAIDGVRRVYRLGGEPLLRETLRVINEGGWIGLEKALTGQTIYGVALFLESSEERPQWDPTVLRRAMVLNAPLRLLARSQEIAYKRHAVTSGSATFAEAILAEYDKLVPEDRRLDHLTVGKPHSISGRRPKRPGRP